MFSICAISRAGSSTPTRREVELAPCRNRASARSARPTSRLITASIRAAVVKSGFRSASRMSRTWVKSKATSRSTRAPAGISPAVGTPWVTLSASPSATTPPAMIEPCATA